MFLLIITRFFDKINSGLLFFYIGSYLFYVS